MANLTIVIDDDVLRHARVRATDQGTSVNAVLREYLQQYAGSRDAQVEAVTRLLALANESPGGRGKRRWTRDELYERKR
jgi:plasmid stability protein